MLGAERTLQHREQRPHRATGRVTPGEAYRATPRAQPAGSGARGHFRLRYDITDGKGAITESGHFRAAGTNASAAYWITDKIVYAIDYQRGFDVLQYNGKV